MVIWMIKLLIYLSIDIQMGFERSPFHVYKPQLPLINEQA